LRTVATGCDLTFAGVQSPIGRTSTVQAIESRLRGPGLRCVVTSWAWFPWFLKNHVTRQTDAIKAMFIPMRMRNG